MQRHLGDGFGSPAGVSRIRNPGLRAARRAEEEGARDAALDRLAAMVRKEQVRWEADRGFEEHRYSDTCWRGFFEDTRAKRVYSHVEKVYTAVGAERRTTPEILEYARK